MRYGILKNVLDEFQGDTQEQITQLEEFLFTIKQEITIVGANNGNTVMFHCVVCDMPVRPADASHTRMAILCQSCAGKLML